MNNLFKKWTQYLEDFPYQEIGDWSLRLKFGLCFVGSLIFGSLSYAFVLMPKMQYLENASQQEKVLWLRFENRYTEYAKHLAKRSNLEKEEGKLEKYLTKIPEQIDLPRLLEDISVLASQGEVVLQSIRVQPQTQKKIFVEVPIEMSVHGHYHQLATFMSALLQLPYLITFQNTMIAEETSQENRGLILNLTLKTYQRFLKSEELK